MNYIFHEGIKGQKWGERNYQYEDGTFKPEGDIRYNRISKKQVEKILRNEATKIFENLNNMSNQDLNNSLNNYFKLKQMAVDSKIISPDSWVKKVFTSFSATSSAKLGSKAGENFVKAIIG